MFARKNQDISYYPSILMLHKGSRCVLLYLLFQTHQSDKYLSETQKNKYDIAPSNSFFVLL